MRGKITSCYPILGNKDVDLPRKDYCLSFYCSFSRSILIFKVMNNLLLLSINFISISAAYYPWDNFTPRIGVSASNTNLTSDSTSLILESTKNSNLEESEIESKGRELIELDEQAKKDAFASIIDSENRKILDDKGLISDKSGKKGDHKRFSLKRVLRATKPPVEAEPSNLESISETPNTIESEKDREKRELLELLQESKELAASSAQKKFSVIRPFKLPRKKFFKSVKKDKKKGSTQQDCLVDPSDYFPTFESMNNDFAPPGISSQLSISSPVFCPDGSPGKDILRYSHILFGPNTSIGLPVGSKIECTYAYLQKQQLKSESPEKLSIDAITGPRKS